ncbi:dihydroneopterin aldolase [Arthrobacter sp. I2-34]|uniref:7,8-dihydroneopterin aldolase n=1 Tax=Arthrobacter hankyongi TaxID=2904801 RepID=A0ABS9LC34_9MICC|nr:dihydroneopterin aldolase [Arthrobacter hankyongi]MCG2624237.1 dihydroneopterin aldolase [Arthrobacter hankyongi]
MGASTAARPDIIKLSGISAVGYHGVFEHERRDGQQFIVDVALHTDTRAAAATDELERTANYGALANQVRDIIAGDPVNLIETLAERIAAGVLGAFAVSAVEVTVHKPQAPIEVPFGDVTVSIYREQDR